MAVVPMTPKELVEAIEKVCRSADGMAVEYESRVDQMRAAMQAVENMRKDPTIITRESAAMSLNYERKTGTNPWPKWKRDARTEVRRLIFDFLNERGWLGEWED